jgi:hypothetical protein
MFQSSVCQTYIRNYKNSVPVSKKNIISRLQKERLRSFLGEMKDIYSENHMKRAVTLCDRNLQFFNIQASGTYEDHYVLKVKRKVRNPDNTFQSFRRFVTFGSTLHTQITNYLGCYSITSSVPNFSVLGWKFLKYCFGVIHAWNIPAYLSVQLELNRAE